MKEFEGKVAVVTGAASGIGLAMARRFAQAGASVVMADSFCGLVRSPCAWSVLSSTSVSLDVDAGLVPAVGVPRGVMTWERRA